MEACADCGRLCSREAASCPNCGKPLRLNPAGGGVSLEDRIFDHILTQSSVKIGLCLTLLGLIRVVEGVKSVTSFADELLALNAVGFLLSSILSYFAIKEADAERRQKKGKAGDRVFSASLGLLAVICLVIAFELF